MVEVSDSTLIESENKYPIVKSIMDRESNGKWMIRTKFNITTKFAISEGILHLWHDGKVVIFETTHSIAHGSSDYDLRELFEWCRQNEWGKLMIHDRLLVDRRARDYWKNIYLSGIIYNDKLKELEDSEIERLSKSYLKEQDDENND